MSESVTASVSAIADGVRACAGALLFERLVERMSDSYSFPPGPATSSRASSSIRPLSGLAACAGPLASLPTRAGRTALNAAKSRTVANLIRAGVVTLPTPEIATMIRELGRARTAVDSLRAARRLSAELESEHRSVSIKGAAAAIDRAMKKIGYSIESLPVRNSVIRSAGEDAGGRHLVVEIRCDPDGSIRVDAEVLGVRDGSCRSMIEGFIAAARAEGITFRGEPERVPRGGTCALRGSGAPLCASGLAKKKSVANDPGPSSLSASRSVNSFAEEEDVIMASNC